MRTWKFSSHHSFINYRTQRLLILPLSFLLTGALIENRWALRFLLVKSAIIKSRILWWIRDSWLMYAHLHLEFQLLSRVFSLSFRLIPKSVTKILWAYSFEILLLNLVFLWYLLYVEYEFHLFYYLLFPYCCRWDFSGEFPHPLGIIYKPCNYPW